MPDAYLRRALELASRHDFVIASDECYSEIYLDEARPPRGLLQAAQAAGHAVVRALRRVPQPVEALERARDCAPGSSPATRRCSRASGSIAPTTAARCRCTRSSRAFPAWQDEAHVVREPPALPREVRSRRADAAARLLDVETPAGALLPLAARRRRRGLHAWPVRAAARDGAAGHVTSRARRRAAIRAGAACGFRSSRASRTASRPRGASSRS